MWTRNFMLPNRKIQKHIACPWLFFWKHTGQNLTEPTFHLAPAYLENSKVSVLAFELISSWQRGAKWPQWQYYLCGSFSEFRNGAFVHENRDERKVGHIVHHRTYRWTEPVLCAFTLSLDLVCMHCFFYPGQHFLNISSHAASEMLKFRRLNLGRHLTSDSWPSEAHMRVLRK